MKNFKKISIFVVIFCIVFTNFNFTLGDAVSDAKEKVQDIKNEIDTNSKKISDAEEEANEYMTEITKLDSQIGEYESELSSLQEKIDDVNTKIEEYESMLQNSSQRYSAAEEMYTTRLRAIYENGIPSILDLFFESEGISDFFSKMNVYQGILEYDKSLVGNVKDEKEYINNIKSDIEVQKLQLDQLKYDVEKSTTALNNAKDAKEEKVNELNASAEKLKSVNSVLEKRQAEAEAEVEAEIKKAEEAARKAAEQNANKGNSSSGSSSTGGGLPENFNGIFTWPTVSRVINCGWMGYAGHTGIDIRAKIGTPVYAAADGQVITAKTITSDPNGPGDENTKHNYGYGNYIIIYHGKMDDGTDSYSTLYGHLSKVNVSVGQNVKAGQTIGISGNTGNSYGAHLHFEVRVNGKAKNPIGYLK